MNTLLTHHILKEEAYAQTIGYHRSTNKRRGVRTRSRGIEVVDRGDGPTYRWHPDKANRSAQNLDAVVEVAKETATRVHRALAQGQIPLVLGGDCTIEVGAIVSHLSTDARIGLIYFDLHPDLNVPESVSPGALDWMGMAHILGEEKAAAALSHLEPRFPLQPC